LLTGGLGGTGRRDLGLFTLFLVRLLLAILCKEGRGLLGDDLPDIFVYVNTINKKFLNQ
jgi:hypothetical protein